MVRKERQSMRGLSTAYLIRMMGSVENGRKLCCSITIGVIFPCLWNKMTAASGTNICILLPKYTKYNTIK